jgi:hypothetical protein
MSPIAGVRFEAVVDEPLNIRAAWRGVAVARAARASRWDSMAKICRGREKEMPKIAATVEFKDE